MFRSSPPEVFSKNDAVQIRSKPTGEQPRRSVISTKPPCNFIEITPIHGCAPENPQHTRRTPLPRKTHLEEDLWETVPVCQKSFKRLKL